MKGQKIIGVTGSLATGKTTVSKMFAAMGAVKVDADEIAHKLLLEDDRIKSEVVKLLGSDVLTGGEIDRRKLAGKVFFDNEKLAALCRILHPEIIRGIKEQAERFPGETIVVDAPLLIEARLNDYVDIVVVVTAGYETQIKRAQDRGIPEEEAGNIIDNQMPLSEKVKFADYVIDNDGDMEAIKEGVDKIWQKM